MVNTLKLVFSNFKYLILSIVFFSTMVIGLLILSEYIFLEPYVVSHIPSGTELGFVLILIISALSALVIPMNIFRINILKKSKQKMSGGIFGSVIGAAAGACSCIFFNYGDWIVDFIRVCFLRTLCCKSYSFWD